MCFSLFGATPILKTHSVFARCSQVMHHSALTALGVHLLEHLFHLLVLAQKLIDILYPHTRACGYLPAAGGVYNIGLFTLFFVMDFMIASMRSS